MMLHANKNEQLLTPCASFLTGDNHMTSTPPATIMCATATYVEVFLRGFLFTATFLWSKSFQLCYEGLNIPVRVLFRLFV